MTFIKRLLQFCLLMGLMNIKLIADWKDITSSWLILVIFILCVAFFVFLMVPIRRDQRLSRRISVMYGGKIQIQLAAMCFLTEILLYVGLYWVFPVELTWLTSLVNGTIGFLTCSFVFFIGFGRIVATSTQLGFTMRLLLLMTWWIPVWNLVLFVKACSIVKHEYFFELSKSELNEGRKENEICSTKYPILLVHGIFFRDWQFFNYWGRIPKDLIRNGATVFYGEQQSAAAIARSGAELSEKIRQICESEGCEKVNIIAHSKGGLDSRYAISCLGMASQVASLTTVNTPHRGCVFAERLLTGLPATFVFSVAMKYDRIFRRLGDSQPDFFGGVSDLLASKCKSFNEEVTDQEGILYQSVNSKMRSFLSAGFPLCFSFPYVRRVEGENDGLVTPESSKWGQYLGMALGSGRRGVSHGDMVDLMRENIPGFDVTEFYVNIVKGLKEKGL